MRTAIVPNYINVTIVDRVYETIVHSGGEMTQSIDLKRKVGDTRRLKFHLIDETGASINITQWTNFLLTVHTRDAPSDGTTQIFQDTGAIDEGVNGKMYFTPPGTEAAGKYWYDAQATDENGEVITFSEGKYTLLEKRTR